MNQRDDTQIYCVEPVTEEEKQKGKKEEEKRKSEKEKQKGKKDIKTKP